MTTFDADRGFTVPGDGALAQAAWLADAACEEHQEGNDVTLHLDGIDARLAVLRQEDAGPLWDDVGALVGLARTAPNEIYRGSILDELDEVLGTEVENDNL